MSRYCFCAEGAKCHRQHFTKADTIALLLLTLPIANVMTRKSTKAATIKDIAQIAGVTNITVSRVFTAPDKVKPETRERILAAARTLNYVPNAFARNIKASQSPIIGVVTDDTFNIVYSHIIKEVCRLSDAKGYSVMFFTTNGNRQIEARALQTLVSYKAAGIILSATIKAISTWCATPQASLSSWIVSLIRCCRRSISTTAVPVSWLQKR